MATRWMTSKRDTIKRQWIARKKAEQRKAGMVVDQWKTLPIWNAEAQAFTTDDTNVQRVRNEPLLTDSWDLTPARDKDVELPAHIPVKREPCKGIMPRGSFGLVCRKAKGAPVKLWTGTDGSPRNAVAAPTGKGMIVTNWKPEPKVWPIVKR